MGPTLWLLNRLASMNMITEILSRNMFVGPFFSQSKNVICTSMLLESMDLRVVVGRTIHLLGNLLSNGITVWPFLIRRYIVWEALIEKHDLGIDAD